MPSELIELRRLVADDAHACTFQTFGQYRTALLKAIDAATPQEPSSISGGGDGLPVANEALVLRALHAADMALCAWENGYAFDSHGPSREAQRLVTTAIASLTPTGEAAP